MSAHSFMQMRNSCRAMILCLGWFGIHPFNTLAQDVHFSQFAQTPLLINPAFTGVFNGKSRAFINYKNQWNPLGKAYRTSAFSFDTELMKKPQKSSYYGVGIFAFSDRAGDFGLGTTFVGLSFSGIVEVADKQVISGGIQGGIGQRSIDIQDPRTSSQYIGSYDPSLPSGESFQSEPFMYSDFSVGIGWSKWSEEMNMASNDESRTTVGIAYYHVNKPQMAFNEYEERLYSKLVLHGSMYLGIKSTPLALLPTAIVTRQGPATEVLLGSYLRYRIKEDSRYTGFIKETTLIFGLLSRVGDALIPSVMLVVSDYAMGVSYDINTSSLRTASSGRGGIEFSLRFLSPKSLVKGKGRGSKNDGMF